MYKYSKDQFNDNLIHYWCLQCYNHINRFNGLEEY